MGKSGKSCRIARDGHAEVLAAAVNEFRRFVLAGASRRQALEEQIRACASALRKKEARPFFKTRELSQAFSVSLSAVSAAIANVQQEDGLFEITRGHQIVLRGRYLDRAVRLRTLVGLPISLGGFSIYDSYRRFFLLMRCRLRRHNSSGVMTFYYQSCEASHPDFIDRLKDYQIDTVLWVAPESTARENLRSLQQQKIRVICLSEEAYSPIPPHYQIVRSGAMKQALDLYAEAGLQVIRACCPSINKYPMRNDCTAALVSEVKEERYTGTDTSGLLRYLERLQNLPDSVILFEQGSFAQFVALRAPEHLFHLMACQRVCLPHGNLTFHFNSIPKVKADIITLDWERIVDIITSDLLADGWPRSQKPVAFDAEFKPGADLSDHSDIFNN